MKTIYASAATFAVMSVLGGCIAPTSSESTDEVTQGVSAQGITAAVSTVSNGSAANQVNVTVTNYTANPASNWQVAMNFNQSTLTGGVNGSAELNTVGSVHYFSPDQSANTLAPGASVTFGFSVSPTGSNWKPTVVSVNGLSNGASGAGVPSDGVDHIARAVASGALNMATAYANYKLANTDSDSKYSQYDSFIWAAQAYVISGAQIAFDPNVPGYEYIPNQAKAELAFMQMDPGVASYLVSGLQSCFNDGAAEMIYAFRPGVLKGIKGNATTTGSLAGLIARGSLPSGYNTATVVDNYSTTGLGHGGRVITSTLTSTSARPDYWFGLLVYEGLEAYSNTSAVASKYTGGGNGASCSPFNGPGGTANPYFTILLNNQPVAPRFSGAGAQCPGTCTSTITIDPVPYSEPGAYYDVNSNLVGPQPNPFALVGTTLYADPAHQAQWATRTVNNTQEWGTFSQAVTFYGQTKYTYVKQM